MAFDTQVFTSPYGYLTSMKTLLQLSLFALCAFVTSAVLAADVSVTAANVRVSADAVLVRGVFGEAVTAGQVLYVSPTDGRYYLADCNAAGRTTIAGIAVTGGAAGQPAIICIEDPNFTPGFTLSTVTPIYIASATPGGIAPSADVATGWFTSVLLVAKSTTVAVFSVRGHASGTAATGS